MIENYQEEQQLAAEMAEPENQSFATVGGVYADGVSLIFDGAATESGKHYKCNTFFKYAAGDRVHVLKDSGTYVVICVIGNPATSIAADTSGKSEKSLTVGEYGTELPIALRINGYALEYMGGDSTWRKANLPRDNNSLGNYIAFRSNGDGVLQYQLQRYSGTWYTVTKA